MPKSARQTRARTRSNAVQRNRPAPHTGGTGGGSTRRDGSARKAIIQDFIRGVLSGEIITGRLERLAVQRHVEDLAKAGERGFIFREDFALEAIEFVEQVCRHYKGEWEHKPVILEPDQLFVMWCLFGWLRAKDGYRGFQKAYLSMARKWGKSLFAAVLVLLLLVHDNPVEAGAEVYTVATKEQQATIVFNDAKAMVTKSPSLRKRLTRRKKVIEFASKFSFLRPLGSDSEGTDGLNIHAVVKDELHAWREQHRGLHEKIDTACGARRQPLLVTITTAGDDKSLIWTEEDDYATRVVESVITGTIIDDTVFAFICRIDDEDDPQDEKCWIKAQPHLGRTVSIDKYRIAANAAKHKPSARSSFLRYFCNRKTASALRAILPEVWAKGNAAIQDIKGRRGYAAFDLGRSDDFASVAAAFPRVVDGEVFLDLKVRSWTCADSDLRLDQTPLKTFIDRGELIVCEGDSVNYRDIREYCLELGEMAEIRSWAFDPTFAKLFAEDLQNDHGFTLFSFTQSERFYNEPLRYLLQMVKAGRIIHGGDECLAWQAGNLTVKRNRKDEWMPAKLGGPFKIDGMVATLMAISEGLYHAKEDEDTDNGDVEWF